MPVPLSQNNKVELKKLFDRLVRQIRPKDLDGMSDGGGFYYSADAEKNKGNGPKIQNYTKAFFLYLAERPHLTTGEKFTDNTRITFNQQAFQPNDWTWVEQTVKASISEIRFKDNDWTKIKSRIAADGGHQWVDWATTDCFFAAMLHVLGHSSTVESTEKDREAKLADLLKIARKIVADETLIFLMEGRLGWERMAVTNLQELGDAAETGSEYIISYCTNQLSDGWHVVYVKRTSNGWDVKDRQAARKSKPEALPGNSQTETDAWKIDRDSPGFVKLAQKFGALINPPQQVQTTTGGKGKKL